MKKIEIELTELQYKELEIACRKYNAVRHRMQSEQNKKHDIAESAALEIDFTVQDFVELAINTACGTTRKWYETGKPTDKWHCYFKALINGE